MGRRDYLKDPARQTWKNGHELFVYDSWEDEVLLTTNDLGRAEELAFERDDAHDLKQLQKLAF